MRWVFIAFLSAVAVVGLVIARPDSSGEAEENRLQSERAFDQTVSDESEDGQGVAPEGVRSREETSQAVAQAGQFESTLVGDISLESLDGSYFYPVTFDRPRLASETTSRGFGGDATGAMLAAVHLSYRCGFHSPTLFECLDQQAVGGGRENYRTATRAAWDAAGAEPGSADSQALKQQPVGASLTSSWDELSAGTRVTVLVGLRTAGLPDKTMVEYIVEWNGQDWVLVIPEGDRPWDFWTVNEWPQFDLPMSTLGQ